MQTYLEWVLAETPTRWWHDSADPVELECGLARGASGVTTNPVLVAAACTRDRSRGDGAAADDLPPADRAEALTYQAVTAIADRTRPLFERSHGKAGWVCAQVNPGQAAHREAMAAMTRRFHAWRPNVAVKLPATAAGLDVLEDAVAEGITVTATVSFTVAQLIAIAERHRCGAARAGHSGRSAGRTFAVLMIGRVDDYLRDVARDGRYDVEEGDLQQAGLAIAKRAYSVFRTRRYAATLLVAALRGPYHLTALAGADLVMSIHPTYQAAVVSDPLPREPGIDIPVSPRVLDRLGHIPDFVRAYEPDGLAPEDFMTYGATQRTLSQFIESGWRVLERGAA